jgi:hypothetical protein
MEKKSVLDNVNKEYISQILNVRVESVEKIPLTQQGSECLKAKINVRYNEGTKHLFLKFYETDPNLSRENTKNLIFGKESELEMKVMHNWAHNIEKEFYKNIFGLRNTLNSGIYKLLPQLFCVDNDCINMENFIDSRSMINLSMHNPSLEYDKISKLISAYAKFHAYTSDIETTKNLLDYSAIADIRKKRVIYSATSRSFSVT